MPSLPTWAWFLVGYFIFAIIVSPFIMAAIHLPPDDDDEWP
jgi:hypothetical protein